MSTLAWLITGGFAKGYRTQILGFITAVSAVGAWAIGDSSLTDLLAKAPAIIGGLGLAALGAKVNAANIAAPQPKTGKGK